MFASETKWSNSEDQDKTVGWRGENIKEWNNKKKGSYYPKNAREES